MVVLSSFVADADAVFVVSFAVMAGLGEEVVLCEGSVTLDVEVEWDVFVSFEARLDPELLWCCCLVWVSHCRMDDD